MARRKSTAAAGSARDFDVARQGRINEARLLVQGTVGGVGLQSSLVQSAGFETGTTLARGERSTRGALDDINRSFRASNLNTFNQLRTIRSTVPSGATAAIQIAGAGASGASAGAGLQSSLKSV